MSKRKKSLFGELLNEEKKLSKLICLIFLLFYIALFLLGLLNLKILIISIILLSWISFVHFPKHDKPTIVLSILTIGAVLLIVGAFALLRHQVSFESIKYLVFLWWTFILGGLVIRYFACKKYPLEKVDLTVGYLKNKFGMWITYVLPFLSLSLFPVIVAGSFYFFGRQHIYLWLPIFLFWIVSGVRLIKYKVLK